MNNILFEDATTQAEMVRRGECTPLELVDAAIARIEKVNPVINAVIHQRFEKAREEALKRYSVGAVAATYRNVLTAQRYAATSSSS